MAKITKKAFDAQTLLYSVLDLPQIQGLYLPPDSSKNFPRILKNNRIIKNCIPGEETRMTRNKLSDMHLFYLRQIIYSCLIPDIRLFKVIRDVAENIGEEEAIREIIEIEFPRALENNIIGRKNDSDLSLALPVVEREGQIGIKQFEWNYLGKHDFGAERDIEATLTLTMDSMASLTAERENKRGKKYRILDLLIQAECYKRQGLSATSDESTTRQEAKRIDPSKPMTYNPSCFEIMVSAGYIADEDKIKSMIRNIPFDFVEGNRSLSAIPWTDEQIRKEIANIDFERLKTSLYLGVVKHDFNIAQNGKIDLTINYRSRAHISDQRPDANILLTVQEEKEFREELSRLDRELEDRKKDKENADAIGEKEFFQAKAEELRQEREDLIQEVSTGFFGKVFDELLEPMSVAQFPSRLGVDRVYVMQVDREQASIFSSFLENPSKKRLEDLRQSFVTDVVTRESVEDLGEDPSEQEDKRELNAYEKMWQRSSPFAQSLFLNTIPDGLLDDEPLYQVPFVFFGDFLDAVLEQAGSYRFDNFRYVLGNVKIKNPVDGKLITIPIGGIPVSVEMIRSVLEKELVANKKIRYTFMQLVRLFMNQLLKETLGRQATKIEENSNNDITFKATVFPHYGDSDPAKSLGPQEILDVVSMTPEGTRKVKKILEVSVDAFKTKEEQEVALQSATSVLKRINTDCTKEKFLAADYPETKNIIIIHAEINMKFTQSMSKLEPAFKRFIPHFANGQPFGLVKSVSLSKTDLPKYVEYRIEQQENNRPENYLTNLYHANFELIGNDLLTLGSLVYYNPTGLAPAGSEAFGDPADPSSIAYIMGIGGFFLITRISHRMTPGNYTTTVETKFETRGVIKSINDKDGIKQKGK